MRCCSHLQVRLPSTMCRQITLLCKGLALQAVLPCCACADGESDHPHQQPTKGPSTSQIHTTPSPACASSLTHLLPTGFKSGRCLGQVQQLWHHTTKQPATQEPTLLHITQTNLAVLHPTLQSSPTSPLPALTNCILPQQSTVCLVLQQQACLGDMCSCAQPAPALLECEQQGRGAGPEHVSHMRVATAKALPATCTAVVQAAPVPCSRRCSPAGAHGCCLKHTCYPCTACVQYRLHRAPAQVSATCSSLRLPAVLRQGSKWHQPWTSWCHFDQTSAAVHTPSPDTSGCKSCLPQHFLHLYAAAGGRHWLPHPPPLTQNSARCPAGSLLPT
jgi:hypothetical protein